MPWYKITLSSKEVAEGKGLALSDQFGALFMALATPKDSGMFRSRESWTNDYYFCVSPADLIAIRLIQTYAGVECSAPRRSELTAYVSHTGAANVPFAPE
jgi:hypothetical protein